MFIYLCFPRIHLARPSDHHLPSHSRVRRHFIHAQLCVLHETAATSTITQMRRHEWHKIDDEI
jgi:hypothetical protein